MKDLLCNAIVLHADYVADPAEHTHTYTHTHRDGGSDKMI